ncbi:MAG: ABC transporter ATP-binding protein [Spirochaetaceae bacterium]|nr:MAG: ABC transporter ATP-binding protein [Spirochaetaceae bacterium]
MIELLNVTKEYQMGDTVVAALRGVTSSIAQGEFVSIVGPSGSGKSTLMNLIGCLDTPTKGRYILAGEAIEKLSVDRLAELRNATIGFVFQTFNLLPRLTALENVEVPLVYAGVPRAQRRDTAMEMLERVGLPDRARHKPNELSGGQRQRVAIARALASRPAVLLADEPTGALDSVTGEEIMELFQALHSEGSTIILVTHEPALAQRAERMIRMHDGEVAEDVRTGTQSGRTAERTPKGVVAPPKGVVV